MPLVSCPGLGITDKSLAPSSLHPPFRDGQTLSKIHVSLQAQLRGPSSLSPHRREAPVPSASLGPFTRLSSVAKTSLVL